MAARAVRAAFSRSVWSGTITQNTVHGRIPNHAKEMHKMAKTSNKLVNPNAREAMNRFKMEAANDLDVPVTSKSRWQLPLRLLL